MNVLIISDDPESLLFDQIIGLERAIQELDSNVDLLIFSEEDISLNGKRMGKTASKDVCFLEAVLGNKVYDLIAVSLEVGNLKKLFLDKPNILEFLQKYSPTTRTYVYGGPSILSRIEKDKVIPLCLYPRRGVSKLTKEFKNDIVKHIKKNH